MSDDLIKRLRNGLRSDDEHVILGGVMHDALRLEAADLLEECERAFQRIVDNCDKCGGTGNYIEHDGVSGKDLFYECAWCSDYRDTLAKLRAQEEADETK